MKNRIYPTTAVFPSAILTQRRTSICIFLDFSRNISKKIIGLPKFAGQGNIVHCHGQHTYLLNAFHEMDYPVSEDGKGKKTVLKNAGVLPFFKVVQ